MHKLTQRELLALPLYQDGTGPLVFDSLITFVTGKKTSNPDWGDIAVIGCRGFTPTMLITSTCESIDWRVATQVHLGVDALARSRATHYWSRTGVFRLVPSTTMYIDVIPRPRYKN